MPTFRTEVDVDFTYDEFWYELYSHEKKEFLEFLHEEGEIALPLQQTTPLGQKNLLDQDWDKVCSDLSAIRLNITPEEQELIERIHKKYC